MRIPIYPRAVAMRLAVAVSCATVLGTSAARPGEATVHEVYRQTVASDPSGGQLLEFVGTAIRVITWVGCVTGGPAYPGLSLYARVLACT